MVVEEHIAGGGTGFGETLLHVPLHLGSGDVDVHLLVLGEMAHHAGENTGHRAELAGPGGFLVGPAEPGAAVRLPLSRHAKSQSSGSSTHKSVNGKR
jgi:hypothetical protein